MAAKKSTKQQSATVAYILIFVGIVAAFVLLGILPIYGKIKDQKAEIYRLETAIKKQEVLHPLYLSLYKKAQFEPPRALPVQKEGFLPREDVGRLSSIFADLAEASNLSFESALPRVNTLRAGNKYIMVDLSMIGPFIQLRDFLLKLGGLPYVERLEMIKVQRTQNADNITLKIWLSIKD